MKGGQARRTKLCAWWVFVSLLVCGVRCSVFGVRCSVFGVRVRCSVFRVPCSVFRVPCSVFRVPCSVVVTLVQGDQSVNLLAHLSLAA